MPSAPLLAGIFILTLIVTLASYGKAGVGSDDAFEAVSGKGVHYFYNPTSYGNSIAVAISLIMGVTCANMVHAGYWQRIWAAESNAAIVRWCSGLIGVNGVGSALEACSLKPVGCGAYETSMVNAMIVESSDPALAAMCPELTRTQRMSWIM